MDGDRRVVPGEDFETVKHGLIQQLDRDKQDDPPLDYTIEVTTTHPPLLQDDSGALLSVVKDVLAQQGLPGLSLGAPFATHAGYYCQAHLPTIVIGPGEAHKAHTKDEYISTDQLERGVGVYLGLMRSQLG